MSGLLPVDEAVRRVLDGVVALEAESVPLGALLGRVLAEPLAANRTQPPADVSAMDGYAVGAADAANEWQVVGVVPAGQVFAGRVEAGQAVRIFTGATVPQGADAVLLQEDAVITETGRIRTDTAVRAGQHIRRRGLDFVEGATMLAPPVRLGMRQISLAAAMGHATVPVRRRPRIAILATGDELVLPGEDVPEGHIVGSNGFGIAALVESLGGSALDLGIVRDDPAALAGAIDRALAEDVDVLVTLGGASVGDHDLTQQALTERGMQLGFWKIAMRPGKPLLFGQLDRMRVLGLPGNPVSSLVCALLFLKPLVETLLGLPLAEPTEAATLGADVKANDRRQDYIRALLVQQDSGLRIATPFARQDSSMLSTFAEAGCLIVRPPFAEAGKAGDSCRVVVLP